MQAAAVRVDMGGCPFHTSDGRNRTAPADGDRGGSVDRRAFVKSALLIGGAGAIASLETVAGVEPTPREASDAPVDAATRDNRQHAWDAFEPTAATGNTAPPPNGLFLMLDYRGAGEPSSGHRRRVADALDAVERHFAWGPNGVMFTVGYSAGYFDRFDAAPPPGAAPDDQATVVETAAALTGDDDVVPDDYDAVLLLASANEANLLATEAALWGEEDAGVSLDATFEGVFERPEAWPDRRVGFAGPALQARRDEYEGSLPDGEDRIPEDAPLSMGFVAGFGGSVADEDLVTLERGQRFPGPSVPAADVPDRPYVGAVGERDPGVFAQGTLKHLSHVELDLSGWYGAEPGTDEASGDDRRRHQMYSPYHTERETNARDGARPGSGLAADDDGPEDDPDQETHTVREYADLTPTTAAGDDAAETAEPTVGHSQKTARSRYDLDGSGTPKQPVLRRDWDAVAPVGTDGADRAGYHFNVPTRFVESVYSLLDATYNLAFTSLDGGVDHGDATDDVGDRDGIAPFLHATRRGNWLVPPITLRALPYPRAADATLSVTREQERYVVAVDAPDVAPLDPDTVRFGAPDLVDRAGGVGPTAVSRRGGTTTFAFPVEGTGLSADGGTAKLFGKARGTRRPVIGVAST